jgi:hypothetical protein
MRRCQTPLPKVVLRDIDLPHTGPQSVLLCLCSASAFLPFLAYYCNCIVTIDRYDDDDDSYQGSPGVHSVSVYEREREREKERERTDWLK